MATCPSRRGESADRSRTRRRRGRPPARGSWGRVNRLVSPTRVGPAAGVVSGSSAWDISASRSASRSGVGGQGRVPAVAKHPLPDAKLKFLSQAEEMHRAAGADPFVVVPRGGDGGCMNRRPIHGPGKRTAQEPLAVRGEERAGPPVTRTLLSEREDERSDVEQGVKGWDPYG